MAKKAKKKRPAKKAAKKAAPKKKSLKRKPAKKAKAKAKPKAKKPAKKRGGRKPFPKDKVRNELVTMKVSGPELQALFSKADKLAGGNVSKLLRHAVNACKTKAA